MIAAGSGGSGVGNSTPLGRLRLLVVSQPLTAGVPRHVIDLLHELDPARFDIHVACPPGSELWAAAGGFGSVRRHPFTSLRAPAISDLGWLFRLIALIRHADIIHAHSTKAGLLARLAAAITGRRHRCVFTPHAWSFWALSGWRARLAVRLEGLAAHACAAIVCVSDHERAAGLAVGVGRPSGYRVIPNGVHLQRFNTPRAIAPGRVLMVARLSAQKRPGLAIRAMAELRRDLPGAELHLVGDGPLLDDSRRLASGLGLGSMVRFLGVRSDVPRLLSEAACLLLVSGYEGCPLSLLEAMAAGVPVVAVRSGGIDEVVEHGRTGLLAEPEPMAIAAALLALLVDSPRAVAMGEAARAAARERFCRRRMADRITLMYEELAARAVSGRRSHRCRRPPGLRDVRSTSRHAWRDRRGNWPPVPGGPGPGRGPRR